MLLSVERLEALREQIRCLVIDRNDDSSRWQIDQRRAPSLPEVMGMAQHDLHHDVRQGQQTVDMQVEAQHPYVVGPVGCHRLDQMNQSIRSFQPLHHRVRATGAFRRH